MLFRSRLLYYEEFLGYIPQATNSLSEPLLHNSLISIDELAAT